MPEKRLLPVMLPPREPVAVVRVIVCGSRGWHDRELILRALSRLPAGSTVVHGGARGADRIAGEIARDLGFNVEEHPADWTRFGRAAGPIRNEEMARLGADLVLAFRLPGRSPGTDDMIRRARRAGIPVRVYAPDEGSGPRMGGDERGGDPGVEAL